MFELRLRKDNEFGELQWDVGRIVKVFSDRGYVISPAQAKAAWDEFSDSMAAGWMGLPDSDEDVFWTARSYFEEVLE